MPKPAKFTIEFLRYEKDCFALRITRCHDKASNEMLVLNPELAKALLASIRAKKVTVLP